jgi:hypothetical protein
MSASEETTERDWLLRRTAELSAETLDLTRRKPFDADAHVRLREALDEHRAALAAYRSRAGARSTGRDDRTEPPQGEQGPIPA